VLNNFIESIYDIRSCSYWDMLVLSLPHRGKIVDDLIILIDYLISNLRVLLFIKYHEKSHRCLAKSGKNKGGSECFPENVSRRNI